MALQTPLTEIGTIQALSLWYKVLTKSLRNKQVDLSSRQTAIMLTVYLLPAPHTVKSLAQELNISKPAVSRAVTVLQGEELLRKKIDEADRRNVLVQRTLKGTVYLSEFSDIIIETLRQYTATSAQPPSVLTREYVA